MLFANLIRIFESTKFDIKKPHERTLAWLVSEEFCGGVGMYFGEEGGVGVEVFCDDSVDIGGERCAGVAYCADDVEEFAMVFRRDVNPMVYVETFGSEEGGVIVLFCHGVNGFYVLTHGFNNCTNGYIAIGTYRPVNPCRRV